MMKHYSRVKTALLALAVISFASLSWTPVAAQQTAGPGQGVTPYVIWSGQNSKITRRSYYKVTTRQAWVKLWYQHIGKKAIFDEYYNPDNVPEIDFKTCMVIAAFQGAGFNNAGVRPHSVIPEGNLLRVRLVNRKFQTWGGADKVTPYGMFVMPRSDKQILIEEDVHRLIGEPPLWKERARLK